MEPDSSDLADDSGVIVNAIDEDEIDHAMLDDDFLENPELRFSVNALRGSIYCVSVSNALDSTGSRYLALGCMQNVALVWVLDTGVLLSCIKHEETVITSYFDRLGKFLLTADLSGQVNVFAIGSFDAPLISFTDDSLEACYWHPFFHDIIVMIHESSKITFCSATNGQSKYIFPPNENTSYIGDTNESPQLHFLPSDPTKLLIVYFNGTIRLYDSKNDCSLLSTSITVRHQGIISSVLTPNESLLITGTYLNNAMFVYNSQNLRFITSLQDAAINNRSSFEAIVVTTNSEYIVSGTLIHDDHDDNEYKPGQIAIWDMRYSRLHRVLNFQAGVTKMILHKGFHVIAGFVDGWIRFIDSVQGSILKQFKPHSYTILFLHFDYSNYLLSGADDGRFMVLYMDDINALDLDGTEQME